MSRGNKKRRDRGEPLKYKSKNGVNWSAVDYAIEVGKSYYRGSKRLFKTDINKFKSLFMSFVTDRKERKEPFTHKEAVRHTLNLLED